MNHKTATGPTGFGWIRSALEFRHHSPLARLVSTIAAFTAALLLVGANVAPAQAAVPCQLAGGFEIEGDMVAQNCVTPGDDWSAHTISPTDVASTSQGGTYSPSGSDTGNPSTWVSSGSTPSKGDFGVAYSFAKIVNGHYIVYVSWERDATAGTGGYVIELDNSAPNAPGGVPQPDRTNGGSTFYLSATGSAAPTLTCDGAFTSVASYGPNLDCPPPSLTGFYSALNTSGAITDSFSNASVAANGFYEVALDMTALTGVAPSCPGPDAASLYIRSLTGQVKNGNLKGYLAPLTLQPDSTCVAPTITTQTQSNAQIDGLDVVAPGTPQHDVATVTGTAAHPAPTGSVTFSLCGPTLTATDCTTGGQSGGAPALVQHASNSTAQSSDLAPTAPGWYCWRAAFTPAPVNGNNPFLPATATTHTNECFLVAHASPTIATQSSGTTAAGAAAHSVGFTEIGDTATLSGVYAGASLTGQHVTFSLYGPSGTAPGVNDCTGTPVYGPVNASLTQVDNTTWHAVAPAYTPTAVDGPGYYTWVASYDGDAINGSAAGACGAASETQHLVGPLLSLTKGTPHSTITAGDDVVYDVDLANIGAGSASNVTVTDVLPILAGGGTWTLNGTSGYSCSIAAGTGPNAGHQVVTCAVGELDPSSKTQIAEVSAPTTPVDCGDINNTAVLTADPNVQQTAGPVKVTVQCPGLAITKVADAASVTVGSPIGFTVSATNNGQGTASGVLVHDVLPVGPGITWTVVGSTGPLSCAITAGVLDCTGSLTAGAIETVHITSPTQWTGGNGTPVVNSCLGGQNSDGVYDNTAHVSATNVVGSPSDSAHTQVLCPDLDVTKTADHATVNAGAPIGFTITASNSGAAPATGALVNDPLPTGPGITWTVDNAGTVGPLSCGIAAGTLTCTGTLPAGATQTVHVTSPTQSTGGSGAPIVNSCLGGANHDGVYDNTATFTATDTPQAPSDSATTRVLCPDLTLSKSADHGSVDAGSQIGFTVTAANSGAAGTGTAAGVVITDPLPAGAGVDWSVESGAGNCSITGAAGSQTLTCSAASLAPGASESVHVVSGTSYASCKAYPNTASLTATNHPSLGASATTTVLCPDVTLTKAADHVSVDAGSQIGFTVTASNSVAAAGTATGVVIDDALPAGPGVDWSIESGPVNCSISGAVGSEVLTCTAVSLAPGASEVVHVVSGTSSASCKAYPNTANLTATTNHPSLSASATTTVLCPGLNLTKTADHVSVDAGSQIGFTVTAANSGAVGTGTAAGVVITDPLPAGAGVDWSIESGPLNCSISGAVGSEVLTCTAVDLAPGASEAVHVISGTSFASCNPYPNVASLTATNSGNLSANATTTVNCPDVSLVKTADHGTVDAGSQIGFTVTASNSAAAAGTATGVVIDDLLPAGSGVNWSIESGPITCTIDGGPASQTLHCAGVELAPGTSESVHVVSGTSYVSCQPYANTADLTSTNHPPLSASATTTVLCPDVTLTKTADHGSVDAGSQIGFTVTAANSGAEGTGTATGVVIDDALPAGPGVDWTIATGPENCSITGAVGSETLTCTSVSLAPGASESVHVVSGTSFASCKAYPNTADLTAANHPSLSDSATTTVLCPALSLTKTADAALVTAGGQIGFTITAANGTGAGVGTAHGVVIDDPLPGGPGVDWSIAGAAGTCSIQGAPSSETLHCTAVDLAPGASESVHVVSATTTASCKVYPNVASLTAGNAPGLTASADTTVSCPIVSPPKQQPHPHVLPNTGGPNGWLFAGGLALLLAGGSLVLTDRRRRRS